MRYSHMLAASASLASSNAWKLLVASYKAPSEVAGPVRTLEYHPETSSLNITYTSHDCGTMPSWLEMSSCGRIVTCVDEAIPGSLTMLSIKTNGGLEKLSSTNTLGGPVSSQYFNNESAVALAHVCLSDQGKPSHDLTSPRSTIHQPYRRSQLETARFCPCRISLLTFQVRILSGRTPRK